MFATHQKHLKSMAKCKRSAYRKNIILLATCNVSDTPSKPRTFLRLALSRPKLNAHAQRNAELREMNRRVAHLRTITTKRSRATKQKNTANIAYYRSFDMHKLFPRTKRQKSLQQKKHSTNNETYVKQ